jgi:hypothetical protein
LGRKRGRATPESWEAINSRIDGRTVAGTNQPVGLEVFQAKLFSRPSPRSEDDQEMLIGRLGNYPHGADNLLL